MKPLIIFEKSGRLYADSREIAALVGKSHKNLLRDIQTYIGHLNKLKIESVDFFKEAKYLDDKGEQRPCFDVTHKGCDLIAHKMTGTKGTAFSATYIDRFYEMDQELTRRRFVREDRKLVHRSLMDALRDSGEYERMHGRSYSTYQNMIYKVVLGQNAKQIRYLRGGNDDTNAIALLTASELEIVTEIETRVCVLLDCGMIYDQIKPLLMNAGLPVRNIKPKTSIASEKGL